MKIGQRDVWIGIGKGERTPKKWWIVCSPLGREWIPPYESQGFWQPYGSQKGFWQDVPRRFAIYGPAWHFMLALTPGSRWAKMRDRKIVGYRWIELERRR